jgi:hypothetical protein
VISVVSRREVLERILPREGGRGDALLSPVGMLYRMRATHGESSACRPLCSDAQSHVAYSGADQCLKRVKQLLERPLRGKHSAVLIRRGFGGRIYVTLNSVLLQRYYRRGSLQGYGVW